MGSTIGKFMCPSPFLSFIYKLFGGSCTSVSLEWWEIIIMLLTPLILMRSIHNEFLLWILGSIIFYAILYGLLWFRCRNITVKDRALSVLAPALVFFVYSFYLIIAKYINGPVITFINKVLESTIGALIIGIIVMEVYKVQLDVNNC